MAVKDIENFVKLLQIKRYSPNTITSYTSHLKAFKNVFSFNDWNLFTDKELLENAYEFIVKKQMAYNTQKQFLSALQLFYGEMFARNINFQVLAPKRKPEFIPVVLAKSEVKAIIDYTNNIKHKAIISALYGLGLRSGELINLKIIDIDGKRNVVTVKNGKGQKDRTIMLSEKLKLQLREYFKKYQPKTFLFEGQKGDAYTQSSLQSVVKQAAKRCNISKTVTSHTFRHSFATHLLEQGVDIRIIQKLLGHKNIKTTQIYTQVSSTLISQVISPLDML